jgi:hypothetical protein
MTPATLRQRPGATDALQHDGDWLKVGQYDPGFKDAVAEEIEALGSLKRNWDSYGAPPIDQKIIAAAVKFIRSLPDNIAYRPRVVPMSPGNFQLEWHHGRKVLELEFETPATIRFLQWKGDQHFSEEDTFPVQDIDRAIDLIQWFMSGTCL